MLARKRCLLILFVITAAYSFLPDGNGVKLITEKLEKFRKSFPQEKVHLHVDKPIYSTGDTLYFTAYVVKAEKNMPSAISNVLYVDIIKDTSIILPALQFPINDGIAPGSVILPDSLPDGTYRIRAYTNWMRNFDDAFFATKTISIGNGLQDDLVAEAGYRFDTSNKNRDSVIIHYYSLHDLPVAGKEIRYGILSGKKESSKGKAITNQHGDIAISAADINLSHEGATTLLLHVKTEGRTATKQIVLSSPALQYNTQFFPEGGQMIAGIPTRVGFKALNINGRGADVSGKIIDENLTAIASFQSSFAGIGSFVFTPLAGHHYRAVVAYKNGSEQTTELPLVANEGYALSADNGKADSIHITVNVKGSFASNDKMYLVAQCNNRVQYVSLLSLVNDQADLSLSKKKFPTGILQFTLFDTTLSPVAERLVFINHSDALNMEATFDKALYGKRDKVVMKLHITDKNKNPVQGSFSLAVTDAGVVAQNEAEQGTILSDLLLTSDLKGYVEQPTYYFTNVNDAKAKALDDLLLTQGWRRFLWKDILHDNYPVTSFSVEKSLSVRGSVVTKSGERVAGSRVTLLSKSDERIILDTLTDANGNFVFDDLFFTNNNPFVVKAARVKGNVDVQVKMNPFSPPSVSNVRAAEQTPVQFSAFLPYLKYSIRQYDEKRKNGWLQNNPQLKEVVVTSTKQTLVQQAVAPSANLNGPGHADQILTYADLQNCHELGACLQGKLVGVYFKMVVDDPKARVVTWRMKAFSSSGMGQPMVVILDGMELTGFNLDMRSIVVQNIQSIEVLRTGAYLSVYGTRAAGGALIITTKKGDIDYNATLPQSQPVPDDFLFTTAQGYASAREFYTPPYDNPVVRNTSVRDLRSTIFWKPNITTDEEGNAVVEWYNADTDGRCNVMIEGLSMEGKPGFISLSYPVKP